MTAQKDKQTTRVGHINKDGQKTLDGVSHYLNIIVAVG